MVTWRTSSSFQLRAGTPKATEGSLSYCGIVEVRSLEDALGATCGRSADEQCFDCATALCSAHTKQCQLCGEIFCPSCLSLHQREHPKPVERRQSNRPEK